MDKRQIMQRNNKEMIIFTFNQLDWTHELDQETSQEQQELFFTLRKSISHDDKSSWIINHLK